jgi:thiazole synthase
MQDKPLVLGGKTFSSRLIVGTGKYPDFETMRKCHEVSGSEMVTVALGRVKLNGPEEWKTPCASPAWPRPRT